MAGHFPRSGRYWIPPALGLAAMVLAWLPATAPAGAAVALLLLGAVLVWQLRSLPSVRDRWAGCSDTVAMAALVALTTVAAPSGAAAPEGSGGTADMPGMAGCTTRPLRPPGTARGWSSP